MDAIVYAEPDDDDGDGQDPAADSPFAPADDHGGAGEPAPTATEQLTAMGMTWEEMDLLRRAAREDWGVPSRVKSGAIFRMARILEMRGAEQLQVAASRVLVAFDRADLMAARVNLLHTEAEARRAIGDIQTLRDFLDGKLDNDFSPDAVDGLRPGEQPARPEASGAGAGDRPGA